MKTSNTNNVTNNTSNTSKGNTNMNKLTLADIMKGTTLTNSINAELYNDPIPSDLDINPEAGFMSEALFSEDGGLSTDSRTKLDLERKLAVLKKEGRVVSEIEKAIAFTRAINLIKYMGEFSELKDQVIFAALQYTKYWKSNKYTENRELTAGRQIYKNLLRITDKNSVEAKSFLESYTWLHDTYTLDENDTTKTLITEPKSVVRVNIMRSGIGLTIDAGSELVPTNGAAFVFKRKLTAIYGIEVFNTHLSNVLRSIRIHNEFLVKAQTSLDKDVIQFRKDHLRFRKADVLGLLLLLKLNNISTKELFESYRKGNTKGLALVRKLGTGKLERMYVPSYNFAEVYEQTGIVSLSEARQGYFTPMVSIPRLAEFHPEEGQVVFRENVNKTLNRADKLHDKDGWVTSPTKLLVIADATVSPKINRALLSGAIFMPSEWLEKWGCCRVVTSMDQGGIKAATTSILDLDPVLDAIGAGIVGPASFKGGLLAALALASGNPDIVKNLSYLESNHSNCKAVLERIKFLLNKELKTFIIAGEEVQGFVVELPLTITNPYTVESVMIDPTGEEDNFENFLANPELLKNLDNLQAELETGVRSINGLRDKIMERAVNEPDFKVTRWIDDGLASGNLKYKPAFTRVISSELQSLVYWYGKTEATKYLKALLNRQAKGMDETKILAAQWITGNLDIRNTVSSRLIAEKLLQGVTEYKFALKDNSPMYARQTIEDLFTDHFTPTGDLQWVGIKYPNGVVVPMPIGNIFSADLEQDLAKPSRSVLVKGLFADLLENIKSDIVEGEYNPSDISDKMLAATIQKPLLGKHFGYQYTPGMYGVMLPLLTTDRIDHIELTARFRISNSDHAYVKMNGSKAPQLFHGATAGYKVYNKVFNRGLLNIAFACAIFITPEATMILQNDHDGDLFRLTLDGHTLPMFKGPFKEFNSKFFTDSLVDELTSNRLSIKEAQMVSLREFHTELFNAVEAKGKVGQYTANKYFYEVAFENFNEFVGTDGATYSIDSYDKYVITAILAQLVQDEAMNNIKQEGSKVAFTELTLAWNLGRLKGFGTVSTEEVIATRIDAIVDSLGVLNDKYEMGFTKTRMHTFAQALCYAATTYNRDNMLAFSMMNTRCVEYRNALDITSTVTVEDYEYKGTFDFFNSYERIVNCADTNSMYHDMVKYTVETVFGADEVSE